GAGREQKRARIIRLRRAGRCGPVGTRRLLVRLYDRKGRMRSMDQLVMLRPCDRQLRLDDRELMDQISTLKLGIDWMDRDTEAVECEPNPKEFWPILQNNSDARSAPISGLGKDAAQSVDAAQDFAIGVGKAALRIGELSRCWRNQERCRWPRLRARNES